MRAYTAARLHCWTIGGSGRGRCHGRNLPGSVCGNRRAIPDSPAGSPTTSHLPSPPCGKVSCQPVPTPLTCWLVWETGPLSRPLSFMGIRAMPIMSLRSAGLRSCRGKYIAVGCLEDMHTPARSIPTRTGGRSLNAGTSTERGTLGREVAPPAHTPIRAGRTPRGRCCAFSSTTRAPCPARVDSAAVGNSF
jgi:hypothetical protein